MHDHRPLRGDPKTQNKLHTVRQLSDAIKIDPYRKIELEQSFERTASLYETSELRQ